MKQIISSKNFLSDHIILSTQVPSKKIPISNSSMMEHSYVSQLTVILKKKDSTKQTIGKQKRAQVAHAGNPNYSGGREQEDNSSKPAPENSL
jgi:hypothetical protein